MNYGLTPDLWLRQLGMRSDAFDRGEVSGTTIIAEAMREAAAFVASQLPRRIERLTRVVENEWICRRAFSGQTVVYLGAPCNTDTLIIWLIPSGASLSMPPAVGDSQELTATTDYTVGADNRTITLKTALAAGDRLIASYDSLLVNDCPTLRYHLTAVLNYRLASEAAPESSDRYLEQYNRSMEYFERLSTGRATLAEVAKIETLQDGDLSAGRTKAAAKSEPA